MTDKPKEKVICLYCGKAAKLVTGKQIYPHRPDLYSKQFWQCKEDDAYVGCHAGSDKPLGRLANAKLRGLKMKAHAAFDPIWKSGKMSRNVAYAWLSKKLGIEPSQCHIGAMDLADCKRVIEACLDKRAICQE